MLHPTKKIERLSLLYPILFGISPLLMLWATNLGQIPPFAVIRSFLFVLALFAVTWGMSHLIFRDPSKAALATTLVLFLFYTYGQVYDLLGGPGALQYRDLLAAWGLLLVAGVVLIFRARQIPQQVHTVLTVVGLFIAFSPTVQIASSFINGSLQDAPAPTQPASTENGPDVYYLLVDNYSRSDVLKALGYDNSAFLDMLSELGFFVDPCAQSNYAYTHTSISSTLNMDYLPALNVPIYPQRGEEVIDDFRPLIHNSRVRAQFTNLGYTFISFRGIYPWLNIKDSDIYYDSEVSVNLLSRRESVNFQYLFFHTTMLRPIVDWIEAAGDRLKTLPDPVLHVLKYINPKTSVFVTRPYLDNVYNQFTFDRLAEIPRLPGSKFVYAHIFSAHVPFIYNADGTLRAGDNEDAESYLQSVQYTETRLIEILKEILRDSAQPPVIILQSDHGFPTTPERVKILSAFYLPNHAAPPQGQTPVNTFRMIFRDYFKLDYPPILNQSFHTPPGLPYQFNPVEESCGD